MARRTSRAVPLVFVPAVAAAALAMGCGSPSSSASQRVCVDGARTVVDQQRCVDQEQRGRGASGSFAGGSGGTGATGGGGYVPMHHWYYYPSGSRLPIVGTTAPATGSVTAPSSGGSSSPSGVVRGGFGSTASGSVGA